MCDAGVEADSAAAPLVETGAFERGRQNFETKRGDVEIGLDAIEMRLRIALGIDLDGRQRVGAERFGDGVALFVGFGFLPGA